MAKNESCLIHARKIKKGIPTQMDRPILLTLLLAAFIALVGIGIIAPVMPLYATQLGATGLSLGMIVAGR